MDVSQYLEIFIDETKEHLQTLSDQLMILEQEPENMETINEIWMHWRGILPISLTLPMREPRRIRI